MEIMIIISTSQVEWLRGLSDIINVKPLVTVFHAYLLNICELLLLLSLLFDTTPYSLSTILCHLIRL